MEGIASEVWFYDDATPESLKQAAGLRALELWGLA
jgi:hypothetical protein